METSLFILFVFSLTSCLLFFFPLPSPFSILCHPFCFPFLLSEDARVVQGRVVMKKAGFSPGKTFQQHWGALPSRQCTALFCKELDCKHPKLPLLSYLTVLLAGKQFWLCGNTWAWLCANQTFFAKQTKKPCLVQTVYAVLKERGKDWI